MNLIVGIFALLLGVGAWIVIRRVSRLRSLAERAQLDAEARYQDIFENAFEGIYQSTQAGQFLAANPAMAKMLGYDSSSELISSMSDIGYQLYANQSDRERVKASLISEGGVNNLELQLRRKDGKPIWVSLNSRFVRDFEGKPAYFEGTLNDITERKRSEEERARLSKHNALILDCTAEGIYGTDVEGRTTFVNASAIRMLGYSAAELMGKNAHELIHHHRADGTPYPLTECPIAWAASTGVPCRVDNEVMWRKDGSSFPVEYLASQVIENDVIRGSVVTFSDLGERRALEKELLEKNRELREQNRRIEEANRLKSEFLANMSHELRTPLNGIIGFSELMADEKVGPVSDVHKEFLTDILNSGRHLLQLINDVLDLSKIEAGKMEFRPASASIAKLVVEARDVLKSIAAKKKIKVDVEISGIDQVFIDVGKFKQVLYNYLSNALKFTPDSGCVTVRIEPDAPGFFLLEVDDTGIGIKAEEIPSLFVEFRQLDEGTAKKYSGTGLGLALTRRIVQAQGGRVGVRSVAGKGSTFWAVLPRQHAAVIKDEHSTLPVSDSHGELPLFNRGKVLIVDDDPAALRMMEAMLDQCGYQAICEPTVGGALRAVERGRPQAVILDLLLPGLSGFDFIERFRRTGDGADVPVVVWTAKELTAEDHGRLQYSVQAIVSKRLGGVYPLLEALKPFLPGVEEYRAEGVR